MNRTKVMFAALLVLLSLGFWQYSRAMGQIERYEDGLFSAVSTGVSFAHASLQRAISEEDPDIRAVYISSAVSSNTAPLYILMGALRVIPDDPWRDDILSYWLMAEDTGLYTPKSAEADAYLQSWPTASGDYGWP